MGRYSLVLEEASMDYEVGVTGVIVTPLWRTLSREEAASETFRGRGMWVCWDWGVPQVTILSPAPGKRARPYERTPLESSPEGSPRLGQREEVPGRAPGTTKRTEGHRALLTICRLRFPIYKLVPQAGWQWQRSRAARATTAYLAPANCHEIHICHLSQGSQPLAKLDRTCVKGF